jgi:hypothetical protein
MGPVRFLHKTGARRESVCHKRLFVDIILDLIANQDPTPGRSRIHVIQFSFVSDGGNLAGRQRAHREILNRKGERPIRRLAVRKKLEDSVQLRLV